MKTRDICAVIFFTFCAVSISWAQAPGPNNAITDVPGILVGQYTGTDYLASTGAATGTTVIIASQGAVGGVSQRGGAPGTRETDLLRPENMVDKVNAIVLSGGSAYGLAAADGVMGCLESQGLGWPVGASQVVPIVPSAILFDPGRCGRPFSYVPDASFGLKACLAAKNGPVQQGNVGAGAGAQSGGIKGGLGTASVVVSARLSTGATVNVTVGAIVAVNSSGRTFDANGNLYAAFLELANEFHPPIAAALADAPADVLAAAENDLLKNTTIAVVATNATLTKAQATKVAQMADDGLARAIKTSHGTGDGDTIFALATGEIPGDFTNGITSIGAAAADALSRAVVHAILAAQSVPNCVKSYCDTYPAKCAK
jgi:L-aminopeptidase/D-esterase-like protein